MFVLNEKFKWHSANYTVFNTAVLTVSQGNALMLKLKC